MTSIWLYVFFSVAIIGLLSWLYFDLQIHKTSKQALQLKTSKPASKVGQIKKYEPLRQVALVQKDEFREFYLPVIEKINEYETLINLPKSESTFFDLLIKSLRKRRTVIFENNSAETNRENLPFWTLALFLAILCRYVIRLLNSVEFRDKAKKPLMPYLEPIDALYGTQIRQKSKSHLYSPNVVYLHIINQLVDADVIVMLSQRGMYPYLVNAVTGNYHQRQLPFYTIIESVENHVLNINQENNAWFKGVIELILTLIENNTISKNFREALVFESVRYLYIDRHLLWELFKTYSVFEPRLMTKHDFEQTLIDVYKLPKTTLDYDSIRINVPVPEIADSDFDYYIEITNLIALPYSAIPNYVPDNKIRTKRIKLEREVKCEESESFLENIAQEQPDDESVSTNSKRIEQSTSRKARIKNQQELFSPVKKS